MALEHRAYLYALITREHRKTGESVVKYGMTGVGLAKRMAQYPKDSLMLGACPVDAELIAVAEAALLKAAKQRFRQCCAEGRESFEGDIDGQVALLYEIGKRFKPELRLSVAAGEDYNKYAAANDDRPTDLVARVHAFKTEVCDTEYTDSDVPLLHVHARYTEWLGVTNKRPIGVRKLCSELRRSFGIGTQPSPDGAVVSFKTVQTAQTAQTSSSSCRSALEFLARKGHNIAIAVAEETSGACMVPTLTFT